MRRVGTRGFCRVRHSRSQARCSAEKYAVWTEADLQPFPLGRVLAGANRHDPPLLAPTLDRLNDLGPLPDDVTVHLDVGYDSDKTRTLLDECGLHGRIAHKGEKAPVQASQRWHVERTHAWQNAFHRLARCYERRATVVDAFFDLTDTIITMRSLTLGWETPAERLPELLAA